MKYRLMFLVLAVLGFVAGLLAWPSTALAHDHTRLIIDTTIAAPAIAAAAFSPFGWLGGLFSSGIWSLISGPIFGEASTFVYGFVEKFAAPIYTKLPDQVHRIIAAVLAAIGTVSIAGTVIPLPTHPGDFNATWISGVLSAVVAWLGMWMKQHKAAIAAAAPAAK